jgi:hypothetical protein
LAFSFKLLRFLFWPCVLVEVNISYAEVVILALLFSRSLFTHGLFSANQVAENSACLIITIVKQKSMFKNCYEPLFCFVLFGGIFFLPEIQTSVTTLFVIFLILQIASTFISGPWAAIYFHGNLQGKNRNTLNCEVQFTC